LTPGDEAERRLAMTDHVVVEPVSIRFGRADESLDSTR